MDDKNKKRIYLDNSASTAVDERVLDEMNSYWRVKIGNAGSLHKEGVDASNALKSARKSVANSINALTSENIVFTSGGTESNSLAILGTINRLINEGKKYEELHVVTGVAEHNSVFDCFTFLEGKGVNVTYLPVDAVGRINIKELKENITDNTVLVSVILVNNEIGTIENIRDISKAIRHWKKEKDSVVYPLLHTDASQAPVWMKVDVQKIGVDMLTLDSQKIYGPKGVGCLYVKEKEFLSPILFGGGQEFGLRPGTPPTPLIVGFAKALEIVEEERDTYVTKIAEIRDSFISIITENISNAELNGDIGDGRIAGNINFSFSGIDGEQLVIEMDEKDVAISTKSACLSKESGASRVIESLCKNDIDSLGTVRFSMSRHTTRDEMLKVADILVEVVKRLQSVH